MSGEGFSCGVIKGAVGKGSATIVGVSSGLTAEVSVSGPDDDPGGSDCCEAVGSQMDVQIRAAPIRLEKSLAEEDNLGMAISLAFTPPPNRPARRAIQPAMARTICRVMFILMPFRINFLLSLLQRS